MTEREPTEEMLLAGIAAANRQMPYINDAQKVLAIWKAMQARATPALPQGMQDLIDMHGDAAGNFDETELVVPADALDGMAIVPVEPTDEMAEAGYGALPDCKCTQGDKWRAKLVYKAMLAAAKEQSK